MKQNNGAGHVARRYPIGAEPAALGVSFRVWAPARRKVEVEIEGGGTHGLARERSGHFSAVVAAGHVGSRYRFRLDGGDALFPDPASRFQPDGPHGPSQVIDPLAYRWRDAAWPGRKIEGQVAYEMHVGTFTSEGTYLAAADKLGHLKEIGITLVELMPVNDFPGRFGWGYDGVDLFAPTRLYGSPDDLRRFVDTAHAIGMCVILDVVYNHLGPDGNYLAQFAPDYFTDRYENEWGEAINFDGRNAAGVREFFISNARYWIDEFHFDGLRLDATQSIHDASPEHVIAAIVRAARQAANGRDIMLIGENEPQNTMLVRGPEAGGHGLDALWNDDFHHSAMVALTGRRQAYYCDHAGAPQEFVSVAKHGFLFQGQNYSWQGKRRGTPAFDIPPARFVNFVQNHDQIANSGRGRRFHLRTSPGRARAATALMLLLPGTPMLFQGQEFWASTPFLYFADHKPELGQLVRQGRQEFLSQFPSIASEEMADRLADPRHLETLQACRLDWSECERHAEAMALHRDLLRLRREHAAFARQAKDMLDGSVVGPEAFMLRFFGEEADDRLLLVNFGLDLDLRSVADPLFGPPEGWAWNVLWSSENPVYGGSGTPPIETAKGCHFPGHAAVVLAPTRSAGTEAGKS